ncbi:nitroreductase family protein [Phytohabitans suffuscus]|uniref:nitroreductase family protein n=1 Tax=Phytohabitans suffuscus TaxID=624315 RepID=UPI001563600E|nr:nitroreductase family protein [Phytohabitans suffuscus]
MDDLAAPTLVPSVPLSVPVTDVGTTRPFAEVVAARRSDRHLRPPSLTEVGTVLARAGLTRSKSTDLAGAPIAHRAAPSAGARHPLTLVLLARHVRGLDPGSWILDPDAAVLRPGAHPPEQIAEALHEVAHAMGQPGPPPAVVLAVAHPDRTLSRYPLGISLLWRETGALLMLIHLTAADIGLGSCIVGTCGALHADDGSGTGPVDLGAVALGTTANTESGADTTQSEET